MQREKRTKKTGGHLSKSMERKISRCHAAACSSIEGGHLIKFADLQNIKKASRWRPGRCKICGEYMEFCITNYHAGLHGYKSADALIKDGQIEFIGGVKE